MQALRELVQIVTRNKLKAIDVLDLQAEGDTQTSRLYNLVADELVEDDEMAAEMLYPEAQHTAGYRKVKSRLKTRLLGALFFIDSKKPDYSDRKRAYYQCYRDWSAARILMAKNAFVSSVELAQKVLRIAEKYEFTELALESARFLRLYYSTKEGDRKKFGQYHKLVQVYRDQYNAECDIEYYYSDLLIHFVNKKSTGSAIQARISQYYELCLPLLGKYESYNIQLYGMLIGFMAHSSRHDYQSTLKLCRQARQIFEAKPYIPETPLQVIHYQSLVCHIQLRNYSEGRLAAKKCLSFIEEGTFNWFKYQEMYLLLCTHTGRYGKAYDLLLETMKHNRFPYLPDNIKEVWKVYEAYVLFAVWSQKDPQIFSKVNFRLNRFLNEILTLSKDKRGLNVAILIAQFLLLLREEKYGEMIDRAEALYKYSTRYLQQEETMRSFYFIKLILAVVNSGFQPEVVDEGLLEKLNGSPLSEAKQLHQIEIIPYETIWEMIRQHLKRPHRFASA